METLTNSQLLLLLMCQHVWLFYYAAKPMFFICFFDESKVLFVPAHTAVIESRRQTALFVNAPIDAHWRNLLSKLQITKS